MKLNELIKPGTTILVAADNVQRSFNVSLRADNKYEVIDTESDNLHAIDVTAVESLTSKGFEDAEALEILVYLKDILDGILKTPYAKLAEKIKEISEVYPAPDWLIGQLENLTLADLLAIVNSDEPAVDFKKLIADSNSNLD